MKFADVHCHINSRLFHDDLGKVLERARMAGVSSIVVSGVNPEANQEVLDLSRRHSIIKASLGIYPIDALGLPTDGSGLPRHVGPIDLESEFNFIRANLKEVVAIGEVGMDFFWSKRDDEHTMQQENFRRIIRFAMSVGRPLVVHSRKAEKECIRILKEEIKNMKIDVVNHCFSGSQKLIAEGIGLGHYFSIPANVVKSEQFQMMVSLVPMEQLLTETDAPWLAPVAGERNEPCNVVESAKMIARIKETSLETAARALWDNYMKVFNQR